MAYIPTVVGAAIFFGLCCVLAYMTLTGIQTALVVAALVAVYAVTVVTYLKAVS